MKANPTAAVFVLPQAPKDWIYESVSQIGAVNEQAVLTGPFGTSLGRSDFIQSGVPLLTISCLTDQGIRMDKALFVSEAKAKDLQRYRLKIGDILFSRMASVGRAGIVGPELEGALFNYHIMRLRLDESKLLPKFFTGYVRGAQQVRDYLLAVNHGATRDGINTEQLLAMPVVLAPISEQHRIVAEIEKQFTRLEAGVAALRCVQANLKRYRAAVLKAACEGRLVPTEALLARILTERRKNWQGRGKYKEPAAPNTVRLTPLPEGWTWATVEQLAAPEPNSITDGPFGSNLKTEHYMDSGPRVIRLQNIGDGVYVDEEAHITQEHFLRLQKHRVFANDVVIAGFGENPPRSCIIPETVGPAIVKADCIRFKPHSSVLPKYMNVALNSDPVRKRTKGMVHGVGRPRLNLGEIKSIVIPLPPVAEQTRIVAEVERRLSVVEELETVVTANLQRATRLRQSILQKAFTGELA
jgi:type I restriction enzyme S subunit